MALTVLSVGPFLKFDFTSLLIFSASLAFSDYLRASLLTGFPWNLWAYSTIWANEVLQILNLIGLYSYNLLAITFFTIPVIFFLKIGSVKKFIVCSVTTLIILGLFIYGNYEINKNKQLLDKTEKTIFVKIISPNFDLKLALTKKRLRIE